MRTLDQLTSTELTEILHHVSPSKIIPVIERGLEIERLLEENNEESMQRIREARVLLCLLRGYDIGYRLRLREPVH
jgi:hypothetical protein